MEEKNKSNNKEEKVKKTVQKLVEEEEKMDFPHAKKPGATWTGNHWPDTTICLMPWQAELDTTQCQGKQKCWLLSIQDLVGADFNYPVLLQLDNFL